MSSRLAMILAMMLLGGAGVAAYFAWTLSQPKEASVIVGDSGKDLDRSKAEPEEGEQAVVHEVVFARQAIGAGSIISADQLTLHALPVQPPHIYDKPDTLVGKRVWRDIEKGEMIRPGHLRQGSALAATLLPTERALAIEVDEVVGTGGLLAPGDSVDVLLYLREAHKDTFPSAQIVLENVRLLSFVERVQPSPDAATDKEPERADFRGKTAVLAVPREDLTRLMLASSAGTLRLALRSATSIAEPALADSSATDEWITNSEMSGSAGERSTELLELDALLPARPEPRQQPAPAASEPEKTRIQVHRGGASETVELP